MINLSIIFGYQLWRNKNFSIILKDLNPSNKKISQVLQGYLKRERTTFNFQAVTFISQQRSMDMFNQEMKEFVSTNSIFLAQAHDEAINNNRIQMQRNRSTNIIQH